jgi:hypothetical protein
MEPDQRRKGFKATYGTYFSKEAHLERLNDLLKWAQTNKEISECLAKDTKMKATRLLREESKKRFGVGTRLAKEYAQITYVRLKTQRELYTRWGYLDQS